MAEQEIVNRVAQSALITLNLEDHYHTGERVAFDIKDLLYEGIILKEKDFRAFVKAHDWTQYTGKNVYLFCSEDAIIPVWAYMLLASRLEPYAHMVVLGDQEELEKMLFKNALSRIDLEEFQDAKVVVKGCGKVKVPDFAYVEITRLLRPVASSIMFGEPCSTVPVYKKPRE